MAAVTKSNDGKQAMPDDEESSQDQAEARREPRKEPPTRVDYKATTVKSSGPSFFAIYKKGHGYWTRMGTAIGAGCLGLIIAFELYSQIPTFLHGTQQHDKRVAFIAAAVFLIAYSIWAWWFTNKPSTVEFLIATDSEMKKVNWTTRKELIGSTKVVIIFMFIIAMFLFTCDLVFGAFFHLVGVLKTMF
jgi:preprotein translocase SecE subunit